MFSQHQVFGPFFFFQPQKKDIQSAALGPEEDDQGEGYIQFSGHSTVRLSLGLPVPVWILRSYSLVSIRCFLA